MLFHHKSFTTRVREAGTTVVEGRGAATSVARGVTSLTTVLEVLEEVEEEGGSMAAGLRLEGAEVVVEEVVVEGGTLTWRLHSSRATSSSKTATSALGGVEVVEEVGGEEVAGELQGATGELRGEAGEVATMVIIRGMAAAGRTVGLLHLVMPLLILLPMLLLIPLLVLLMMHLLISLLVLLPMLLLILDVVLYNVEST